jgi:hypothetical protein
MKAKELKKLGLKRGKPSIDGYIKNIWINENL